MSPAIAGLIDVFKEFTQSRNSFLSKNFSGTDLNQFLLIWPRY
jgi:hypothetical protein